MAEGPKRSRTNDRSCLFSAGHQLQCACPPEFQFSANAVSQELTALSDIGLDLVRLPIRIVVGFHFRSAMTR